MREAVISHLGLSPVSAEDDSTTHVTNTNTSAALLQGVVSSQLASGSSQSVVYTSNSVIDQRPGIDINNTLVSNSHQSNSSESPLVARVHQSGASINDPLAARVHQSEVDDALNPNGRHQSDISNKNNVDLSDFDPTQYTADDEYEYEILLRTSSILGLRSVHT